ncbi:MAG: hypothetical protein QGH39_05520 [Candidatus Thermoplasmatota archaeon]|jgi:hypothetical protein|nr:hypothetical protein [Candidatus Thermoplasmatota archaeon]MDP7265003.1 hypothetical protein [Candidatus Thermoplasmatota archaeon]
MATPLEYDIPYSAKLYADDLQGGKSRETVLDFTLRNYPPLGISNFSFRLPQPLMPEFSFTAPQDPDSDPIAFYFDLMEEVEGNYSTIISRQYFNQSKYRMRANLSDHSFYTLLLWAEDSHGAASPVYNYSFYLNRAPFPVKNLTVEDLKGYENGLNISWTATDEDDIAKYEIYRFENSTIELEKYGPIAILENDNHYNDLELIDDVTYYYCVVGVDEDGAADHHNFTLVSGIPLDDVPPAPIDDLKVQDRVNSSGSLEISWNASNDGRFQGYRIYRNLFPFNSTVGMYPVHTTVSKMATDTFWIDVNVSDNVSYYYAVVAFDRSGNELQTNLHWVMGISINDTELAQENDEETGDKEKDEESEIRSYFLPIAIVSGVICILSAIILLMILKKSSKKREHKEIVESKTVSSIKADEVENKIEYEKLYGKIGKSQHKQSDKSSKRLKEFAQQRQKRRFREGKYRKKSKEGDGSEEFWIEYEEDNSTEKIEGTDDSWDWLDEPD